MNNTDAQHPPRANSSPTGSLRLSQAKHPINQLTYFREVFFAGQVWAMEQVAGGPLEVTTVNFEVEIDGRDHGTIGLRVDHAPWREAAQKQRADGVEVGTAAQRCASPTEPGRAIRGSGAPGRWTQSTPDYNGRPRRLHRMTTDHVGRLRRLPPDARRDLLRVLTSPSNVRADVIRQFHERGNDGMVDLLADLESDELAREQVILVLRSLDD